MNCQESVEILTTKIGTMKKNYMAGNFDQLYLSKAFMKV